MTKHAIFIIRHTLLCGEYLFVTYLCQHNMTCSTMLLHKQFITFWRLVCIAWNLGLSLTVLYQHLCISSYICLWHRLGLASRSPASKWSLICWIICMSTYIVTRTYVCIHTYTHVYMHARVHTHVHVLNILIEYIFSYLLKALKW